MARRVTNKQVPMCKAMALAYINLKAKINPSQLKKP
jgi:hypothetical protein